jgi:hypothetical protein
MKKLCFTGRLKIGKDYVAQAAGATLIGFADPLYKVVEHAFGKCDKDVPGTRKLLQQLGQWGRNVINEQYPLTAERALFCAWMRGTMPKVLPPELRVDWASFGRDPNIWVKSLLERAEDMEVPRLLVVTNVRFPSDLKPLGDAGFEHFHVVCSQPTYQQRLKLAGLKADAPVLKDMSEQLAQQMDLNVAKALRTQPRGPKMKVIWSDSAPIPSLRLFSVPEFIRYCGGQHAALPQAPAAAPAQPTAGRKLGGGRINPATHNVPGKVNPASLMAAMDGLVDCEAIEIEMEIKRQDARLKQWVEQNPA